MKLLVSSLFLLSLLMPPFITAAQTSLYRDTPIEYLGIEHGLSNNAVTAIHQDPYGFIWIGTYDGLNRYNGYEFNVFRHQPEDSTSLIHNRIVALTADQQARLWVGTKKGLCIYHPDIRKFSKARYYQQQTDTVRDMDITVNDLAVDAHGNVWVGTAGGGLLHQSMAHEALQQYPLLVKGDTLWNYHVQSIAFDADQRLWLFIQGVGIASLGLEDKTLRVVTQSLWTANCIVPDNRGHLWVGSENGLYQYNLADGNVTDYSEGLSYYLVVNLYLDTQSNSLWVATDGGAVNILQLSTDTWRYLPEGHSRHTLTSSSVFSFYEDRDGRQWIGTLRGGVNIIDRRKYKFNTLAHEPQNPNSISGDFVFSFCESDADVLWIGTDGKGLTRWERSQNKYTRFRHEAGNRKSLPADAVTAIVPDGDNGLWVATYGGGIGRYNKQTGLFTRYACYNTIQHYEDRNVWTLYYDTSGTLWAGTCSEGGLYRYDPQQNKFVLFDERVRNVLVLFEDDAHRLWAGTFGELIEIDRNTYQHRRIQIGFPVRAIFQDENHHVWVGTEGAGLYQYNHETQRIATFTENDGLSNNGVLAIVPDGLGHLWLSTFSGISRFTPATKRFRNFYASDGLQSNQFGYNASLRLRSGEIAFGGIHGFNVFYPGRIDSITGFPPLHITGLRINEHALAQADVEADSRDVYQVQNLTLNYQQTMLGLDFVALEYSAPDKIQYAYYLEGSDHEWHYSNHARTANYAHLYEGNYVLHIKSTNADGVWNPQERTLSLVVLPPWYRTIWAYLGSVLFVAALLALYLFYHHQRSRWRYEVKLAQVKAEQEKELNEKKLAFFTNISHEFRTPLTLIINPVKEWLYGESRPVDPNEAGIIYRNARRLLSLVDQLLLFRQADREESNLKIVPLDWDRLCHEVFACFTHQAATRKINYTFKGTDESIEVYADREKLEIVFFNLLSNALKFTPAGGTVSMHLTHTEDTVVCSVRDTGCGIPEGAGPRLFHKFEQVHGPGVSTQGGFGIGLYLVKKFIEDHHGAIHYTSVAHQGTTFVATLQKGKAHFADQLIFEDVVESSVFLNELMEEPEEEENNLPTELPEPSLDVLDTFVHDRRSVLLVDDDEQTRRYLKKILTQYEVYEAKGADEGFSLASRHQPELVICDVLMGAKSGIDLCNQLKSDPALNHIPIILLTASVSPHVKLQGIEVGADDYITKPFDKNILLARVDNLLKSRSILQQHFFNKVTLQSPGVTLTEEYRQFLQKCIAITEQHLDDPGFSIGVLADEMGMSHSNLYKKIKAASGRSASEFVRFIRLRKAAELLISTDCNINEAAFSVGFSDLKYFREQFNKLFDMNPSHYMRRFRHAFQKQYRKGT